MQGKVTILEKFQVSNLWDKQLKHDLAISVNHQQNPGPSEKQEEVALCVTSGASVVMTMFGLQLYP